MTGHCTAPAAAACIRGEGGIRGRVLFYPQRYGTLIRASIWGLPETGTNFFGFHIHQGGSCLGEGFPETGSHYDPRGMAHPRHAGDLPPLLGCGGRAWMAVVTNRFQTGEILGKTVLIHSHPDDFKTQPSGDAGSKIACGVIRRL